MKKHSIQVENKEAMTAAITSHGVEEYSVKKVEIGDGVKSCMGHEFTFKAEPVTLFEIGISYQKNVNNIPNKA